MLLSIHQADPKQFGAVEARRAHNPEVARSKRAIATPLDFFGPFFLLSPNSLTVIIQQVIKYAFFFIVDSYIIINPIDSNSCGANKAIHLHFFHVEEQ
jgi:hypothetical protein